MDLPQYACGCVGEVFAGTTFFMVLKAWNAGILVGFFSSFFFRPLPLKCQDPFGFPPVLLE